MTDNKFTKGEWKIFNERVGVIDNSDTQSFGMMIEVAYIDMYNFGEEEGEANANLIAAAPDMYEMLEFISANPSEVNVVQIRNLLSKARGEL